MLDTSVCVSIIRGRSPASRLPATDECAVSVIAVAELEAGVCLSARPAVQRKLVEDFLDPLTVCPFAESAAAHYGEIRAALAKKGTPIGPLDILIAAHARNLGATLITGNLGEFKRVPGLKVLEWKRER